MLDALADREYIRVGGAHVIGDDDTAVHFQFGCFRQVDIRPDADGQHHQVGGDEAAVAEEPPVPEPALPPAATPPTVADALPDWPEDPVPVVRAAAPVLPEAATVPMGALLAWVPLAAPPAVLT